MTCMIAYLRSGREESEARIPAEPGRRNVAQPPRILWSKNAQQMYFFPCVFQHKSSTNPALRKLHPGPASRLAGCKQP